MMNTRNPHMNFRRMVSIFSLGLLLVVISASLVFADQPTRQPLHVRPVVMVSGDAITFGDVFANAGDLSSVYLGKAPLPGRRLALDPVWLAARATDHGAQWNNLSRMQRIVVSRSGDRMGTDAIARMIADELRARTGNDYSVLLASMSSGIYTTQDGMHTAFVDSASIDPSNGMVTASIATGSGEPVTVKARAYVNRKVPVLSHAIARGEVIRAEDIVWTHMRDDRLGSSAVVSEDELVGKAAKRNLQAGVLLREHDVAVPNAVTKGELVMISYEVPGLRLTTRGKVLANAAIGDTVRAVNLHSNRTINITIIAPGKALAIPGQGVEG